MAFKQVFADTFMWTDTCNVYVVKDGDSALLIDLGDGSVLEHLGEIGVKNVEWVLFTHHHREQCNGAPKLEKFKPKIAAPEVEKWLFENPMSYRKMNVKLSDAFTVHGASYVRPPQLPIKLDQTFKTMDEFTWRGREFVCVDTRGNSPGAMSYLINQDKQWHAFSGDVMCDGARMHNWYDTEWDYGFSAGIFALHAAANLLERYEPSHLLPSHGPVITNPVKQLRSYQKKLKTLNEHYLRGYNFQFNGADRDNYSTPTKVPHVFQVSKHVFKFHGPNFWPNFTMLLADNGHALLIDCGLMSREFLDRTFKLMEERLGLKKIDAMICTHFHGDHCLESVYLKEKYGVPTWTHERVAEYITYPERFDYCAPIQGYGNGVSSVPVERIFKDGETLKWEGFELTLDWMPGQTEFHCGIHGTIDGLKMVWTGDNIFGSPRDSKQTGHEGVVARNSAILEEGYIYAATYLHGLQPDLMIGGHQWLMDKPAQFIERYKKGALDLRDAYRDLSRDDDYRYMYDPYWVRAYPYRVSVKPGESGEFVLKIRNFRTRTQQHRIALVCPPGMIATPAVVEGSTKAEGYSDVPIKVTVAPDTKLGVQTILFDITLDGERHGPLFDMMLNVGETPPPDGAKKADVKKPEVKY